MMAVPTHVDAADMPDVTAWAVIHPMTEDHTMANPQRDTVTEDIKTKEGALIQGAPVGV